jgi:hypothetical protein
MTESLERRSYVCALLASYLEWPDTPSRSRPPDRALARQLYDRDIPLRIVQQAFLLAAARRRIRPRQAPPLQPIRSLYYFLPVIEELLQTPLPNRYEQHLKRKLFALNATKRQRPSSNPATGTRSKKRVFS